MAFGEAHIPRPEKSSADFKSIEEFWQDLVPDLLKDGHSTDLAFLRYMFYIGAMAGSILEQKGVAVEQQVKDWIIEAIKDAL